MNDPIALAVELERLAGLLRKTDDKGIPSHPKELVIKALEWQHAQMLEAVERIYSDDVLISDREMAIRAKSGLLC